MGLPLQGHDGPDLILSKVSTIPDDCVAPFVNAISGGGLTCKIETREEKSYASLEWFIPTAVVIYLVKPYFDKLLNEAAKDHYPVLKRALSALWEHFFGNSRVVRSTVIAFPHGKAAWKPTYSRSLSLVAPLEGIAVKLLLPDDAPTEELDAATEEFLALAGRFYRGERDRWIESQLAVEGPRWGWVMVAFDPEVGRLRVLNTRNGTYVLLSVPPTFELLKLMGNLVVGDRPYGKFRGSGGASIFAKAGRSVTAPCPNTGWESWATQQLQFWLEEDAQAVEKLLTAMATREEFLDAVHRVREADRKVQIETWNGFLAPHGRRIVMTASGATVEFVEPTLLSAESVPTSAATLAAATAGRKDTPVTRPEPGTHVFVSYSHQDAEWLRRLQVHLKPLIRHGTLELWDDSKIKPGAAWRDEIEAALSRASVAVLLVSADFLASDFVADKELPPLLDRAASGGVRIMSVIVGPCLFERHSELSKYQAVNSPSLPLTKMQRHEAEETLVKLAQAIAEFTGS